MGKRLSNKLSKRYYGPFVITEWVGKVSYRLSPATNRIHPVFHVSVLRPFKGDEISVVATLPDQDEHGSPLEQRLAICDIRSVLRKGQASRQVLVQWVGSSPENAIVGVTGGVQGDVPSF